MKSSVAGTKPGIKMVGEADGAKSCRVLPFWISFQMQREDLVEFLGSGSIVKNLSAMQERQVQSLGQEDPLKKEIATHSRILAQEIPWTEEAGGSQSTESQRVGHS